MQHIADLVQATRAATNAADYTTLITSGVTTSDIIGLQAVPVCPNAGAYSLAQGSSKNFTTFKVMCSAKGHGSFEPGVDSQ